MLFSLPTLLFLLTILKKSAYYSSLVSPLFQFKDVKKTIYLWLLLDLYSINRKWNIILYNYSAEFNFAFEKKLFPKDLDLSIVTRLR